MSNVEEPSPEPQVHSDSGAPPENNPKPAACPFGRMLLLPALFICLFLIVMAVMLLFGVSPLGRSESVDELLSHLERTAAQRVAAQATSPSHADAWRAAQELSKRLEDKDEYLQPGDVEPVARRLVHVIGDLSRAGQLDASERRLQSFTMMALAHLQTPTAVAPLVDLLQDGGEQTRIAALRALAEMRRLPGVRRALPEVLPLLQDGRPDVEMVACVATAALADRGDVEATRALARKLASDREVRWNAALSLARLDSLEGKATLMNMLERSYWEGIELNYEQDGQRVRRKYTDLEVSNHLAAAIEAVSHLRDADLTRLVDRLRRQDASHAVREAARSACESRAGGGASADGAS